MGLFDIFKKKQAVTKETVSKLKKEIVSFDVNEFDKSRDLLKQATANKDSDIHKAISLIELAIKICSEQILEDYFKLANYYHISGNKEKAFSIHYDLLERLDNNDIGMYNMKRSQVYGKLSTLSYKEKDNEQHLKFYCLWLFNNIVGFACQGRKEELKKMLDNRQMLEYLAPTKIKGSFDKLGLEKVKIEFNNKLFDYFGMHKKSLTKMTKKAYEIESSNEFDDYVLNESLGQRSNRLLKKDESFLTDFSYFNSGQFENYFETILRPIIKK